VRGRAVTCEETTEAGSEGGTCGLADEHGWFGRFVRVEPRSSYERVPHTEIGAIDGFFSQWTIAFKLLNWGSWDRSRGMSQSLVLRNKEVDVALIDRYLSVPRPEFTLFRTTNLLALGAWLSSRTLDFVSVASLTCNSDDILRALSLK